MTRERRRGPLGGRFARRLTVGFAVTALVAAAMTAGLVNAAFQARFDAYLGAGQQARQQQVVAALAAAYRRGGGWRPELLDQVGAGLAMSGGTAELRDAGGAVIWSSTGSPRSSAMAAMHQQMMGLSPLSASASSPVLVDGRAVGTALIAVPAAAVPALDTRFRDEVNQLLLIGALAAAGVALLAGFGFARRTTAGVVELTAAADDLAAGHRGRRAGVSSRDEIGQLARSFNAMADALAREDELRRGFAGDVAHELRTPLTVLRSQLEAVQDGVSEPTEELIDSLHAQAVRLGRLVADLATMAEAGAAAFTLEPRELALHHEVAAVASEVARDLAERELELRTELDEVVVTVDAARVRQVIENLLTNAGKFTAAGGRITVSLHKRDGFAELDVADTGVGIPADELEHVFDRFFRGAGARAGGSGIGLAVVAELVAAHSGTVTVDSEPGRGTRFRVRLPTAPGGPTSNPHNTPLRSPAVGHDGHGRSTPRSAAPPASGHPPAAHTE